ncbi:SDR family NAD(P)-dependent oxidoreductase [Kutzneria sp. CA-103260]|uniref:SDR family NAD(P)-dependent oxidoreductase n=1 Tax=Kutzneria sp. CA-103260 TaxID=2802641 RepID=UPI001BA9CAF8|nr:SDR family oxidoreductase [Kutzneria sp. CA-103260]QUQ66187.1 3-oxoacyl-ACP reductase [Kutzneria sp. CA-103260]
MDLGLDGKIAVVTGASKGIGLAIAIALVAEGVHVVAGSRSGSPELEALIRDGKAHALAVDLGSPDGPGRLVDLALAECGRVDILVNNVGAATPRTTGFLNVTDEQWAHSVNLNLMAAVRTTRAALPSMLAAGSGCVVNIASINANLPDPGVIDYGAAKAALVNVTKALSKEFGPRGIRVNSVSAGPVATDLWLGDGGVAQTLAAATGSDPAAVADGAAANAVTGRFTRPEEVADLAVFLASDRRAGNVTGANFTIDGGYTTETH